LGDQFRLFIIAAGWQDSAESSLSANFREKDTFHTTRWKKKGGRGFLPEGIFASFLTYALPEILTASLPRSSS
jgi:hypothetical protein